MAAQKKSRKKTQKNPPHAVEADITVQESVDHVAKESTKKERKSIPGTSGRLAEHRALHNAHLKDAQQSVGKTDLSELMQGLIADAKKAEAREVVLVLRRRQGAENTTPVMNLLQDYVVANKPRPSFFSRKDYVEKYGADPNDVVAVFDFLTANKLKVLDNKNKVVKDPSKESFMADTCARRMLRISGQQKDIDIAFGITTKLVYSEGGVNRVHEEEVSVHHNVADIITWVFGLESHVLPRASSQLLLMGADEHKVGVAKVHPIQPGLLESIYRFPPRHKGEGECVGILEPNGGYQQSDLDMYFKDMRVERPDVVSVGANDPEFYDDNEVSMFNMEVTLDVELAAGMAPDAKTAVYFPASCSSSTAEFPQRFYEVLSRAIYDDDNQPSTLALSWGGPETSWKDGERTALDDLFQDAICLGVTVCCASGDSGAAPPSPQANIQTPPVCVYPASSPYVLACGGTSLHDYDGKTHRFRRETAWNDNSIILQVDFENDEGKGIRSRNGGGASGGGISERYSVPDYQDAANVPAKSIMSWDNGYVKVGDPIRGRGVPDVAANAALQTGYEIRFQGAAALGGGTSSTAPIWASLIARLNQGLGQPVGFINSLLYHLQLVEGMGVMHEITEGNNGGYDAHAGWNPCTGLGSPKGLALLNALQSHYRLVSAKSETNQ